MEKNLSDLVSSPSWQLRTRSLDLNSPRIMGILNVTPDSFSDGGQYFSAKDAIARALQIEEEGADILDIGAESTRPGATLLSSEEEWERLGPVLKVLQNKLKIPISLDSYHGEVVQQALDYGVEIINDVSQAADPSLLKAVAESQAAYVLMHCRGTAQNMMQKAIYHDVVAEVRAELEASLQRVLACGISPQKICLDPGFGFSKTTEQNYQLFKNLRCIAIQTYPYLVGVSRKKMLREIVGKDVDLLKNASLIAAVLAVQAGASILRVHDVCETKTAIKTWSSLKSSSKI